MVCFRTAGGIGRHPVEHPDDLPVVMARLARLVPRAEWWCEPETPRGGLIAEGDG